MQSLSGHLVDDGIAVSVLVFCCGSGILVGAFCGGVYVFFVFWGVFGGGGVGEVVGAAAGIHGKPAAEYSLTLLFDFSNGPEGAEGEDAQQGGPEGITYPYGAAYGCYA